MTKVSTFRKCVLATAVAVANAGVALPAISQTEEPVLEEVIVTGIRGSLTNAADIKRDAFGVVDAISAEDIGKFPDTNLAESLQRITGVSIDRANNEGNQVTVRGFGPNFNLVTLNGRQMPNSSALQSEGISRSFNFNEVASESVSGVEVFKTGRADTSSGGIGATINIKTARPLDFDGLVAHVSAAGVMDTSVEEGDDVTPEISGMISNTFGDRDQFGVLASYSYSERHYHVDRIGTQNGWNAGYPGQADPDTSAIDTNRNPTLTTWRVPTVDLDSADYERERENGQLAFQWAATEDLTLTADYTVSSRDEQGEMNRMSFWFDWVETGAADVNGTIIDPFKSNDELNFWAWQYDFETENDSVGFNIDWRATDSLTFTLDIHDSTSHANDGALPAETVANLKNPFGEAAPVHISADFSGNTPHAYYDDSALPGGAYNPANIEADLYQERGYEIENNIKQYQFHGRWDNTGDSFLQAIRFGAARTEYDVDTTLMYSANFGLGGGVMDISDLNLSFESGGIGFEYLPDFSAADFMRLVNEQGLKVPTTRTVNGISEETDAYYISFDFETDIADMPFRMNVGVRYEDTDVESYSQTFPVDGFNWVTPLEMSKIYFPDEISETLEADYDNWLPSLDMSLEVREGMITRFSYSTTIARANIDAMFPSTSLDNHLSTGPFEASQGNPALEPYESDNYDLTFEWYYDEGSYFSVGYFYKEVDNFNATGEEIRTIDGPSGPLTNPASNPRPGCPGGSVQDPIEACTSQPGDEVIAWTVNTPVNLNETTVDGWEINLQHMLGETGFGGIVNYTMVDGDDEFDIYSLENDFATEGLSDSANIVLFYEGDKFSGRLAWNWRDDFLLKGGAGGEPTFTEEYDQLDISLNWAFNETVSVFFDGINITDESVRRHGRFENQIIDYEEYGPRYTLGVRAKF